MLDGLELSAPKIETVHNRTTVAFPAKILAGQKSTSDHLPVLIVYTDAGGQAQVFTRRWRCPRRQVPMGSNFFLGDW